MSEPRKTRSRPNRFDILIKRIYIAAGKRGISREQVHDIVREMTDGATESTKCLWPHEKKQLLRRLEGDGPYAATKEQIWAIENIWLLPLRMRKGWEWGTFEGWLRGPQSPISPPTHAQEVINAWPSREARRIRISAVDASRIIEGLKGLWIALLGTDDPQAEYRRLKNILKLIGDRPEDMREAFHQMKSHITAK